MDINILENISREFIDKFVKRDSSYVYKVPTDTLNPYEFGDIINRIYMILYLSTDIENKDSKYNKYCDNFVENLSAKINEELYIKCMRNNNKNINDYVKYLRDVLSYLIIVKNNALINIFNKFKQYECSLFYEINDLLEIVEKHSLSPVKMRSDAFKDIDDIETIKYYIYETEIMKRDVKPLKIDDIKLIFNYLNISVLYKSQHNTKKCMDRICKSLKSSIDSELISDISDISDASINESSLFGVIKYKNSNKNVSFEFVSIADNIEKAKKLAKKYANNDFNQPLVDKVKKQIVNIETIVQYTIKDGYNKNVYAVIALNNLKYDSKFTQNDKKNSFEIFEYID